MRERVKLSESEANHDGVENLSPIVGRHDPRTGGNRPCVPMKWTRWDLGISVG